LVNIFILFGTINYFYIILKCTGVNNGTVGSRQKWRGLVGWLTCLHNLCTGRLKVAALFISKSMTLYYFYQKIGSGRDLPRWSNGGLVSIYNRNRRSWIDGFKSSYGKAEASKFLDSTVAHRPQGWNLILFKSLINLASINLV